MGCMKSSSPFPEVRRGGAQKVHGELTKKVVWPRGPFGSLARQLKSKTRRISPGEEKPREEKKDHFLIPIGF